MDEAGKDFQAWTLPALLTAITRYRRANGMPVPVDLEDIVLDFTCRGLGGFCQEVDARYNWLQGTRLRFASVIAGTEVLGKWIIAGKPMVPQELADSRSEVCAGCSFNQDAKDCQVCAWPVLTRLVSKLLGDRKSKRHADLKACASCGCSLKLKCHIPLEHLKASFSYGEALPGWCWISAESKHE